MGPSWVLITILTTLAHPVISRPIDFISRQYKNDEHVYYIKGVWVGEHS